MYVVLIGVHCFEHHIGMMLRPRFEKLFEVALNSIVENLASVFGGPDKMVVTDKDKVAHSPIRDHLYSIVYLSG